MKYSVFLIIIFQEQTQTQDKRLYNIVIYKSTKVLPKKNTSQFGYSKSVSTHPQQKCLFTPCIRVYDVVFTVSARPLVARARSSSSPL